GEDGRIKSAIGIGSLLYDGLGDTIRVSLTEDAVYEIPVAQALARQAMAQWSNETVAADAFPVDPPDAINPFEFERRPVRDLPLTADCLIGPEQPPRVITRAPSVAEAPATATALRHPSLKDNPTEGLLIPACHDADLEALAARLPVPPHGSVFVELAPSVTLDGVRSLLAQTTAPLVLVRAFTEPDLAAVTDWLALVRAEPSRLTLALGATAAV